MMKQRGHGRVTGCIVSGLLLLLTLAFAGSVALAIGGCKSTGPKDFNEAMVLINKAQEIAKEQGVAWYADLVFDGSPAFYETASFGFKSGIEVRIHFQGNAQSDADDTGE